MLATALDTHLDLTNFSNTIPSTRKYEIQREYLIKNIEDTFSFNNKVILVEGEHDSGKTTLLAQFTRKHSKHCISFFVGDDYWKSNVNFFLSELCVQMAKISSDGLKSRISKYNIEDLQGFELEQLFQRLYTDLCKQARQKNNKFYFVIDGLDKIENSKEVDNILKFLPKGDSDGVYVLLSSLRDFNYDFDYYPMQIQYFSRLETETILNKHLTVDEIGSVYNACEGMPGYVIEILRQLEEGGKKVTILNSLPSSFFVLLENTWSQYDNKDEEFIKFLSLITFAPEPLSIDEVKSILNLSENKLLLYLDEVNFISHRDGKLHLLSAYKTFLNKKLENKKVEILQSIIEFYENNEGNFSNSLIYLPELYQHKDEYKSLVNLLDIGNILKVIQSTNQLSTVRKNLRILTSMAYKNSDWKKLSWSVLTESVFTEIATTPPAVEGQIKALLSLDRYQDALKLAFSCALPEDRLSLLSHICIYMKKNNIEISADILVSIEESINLIDNTVDISEKLISKLIDICSNIFPIDASLSLKLIKRIAKQTGENVENEKLMDYLLVRLILRVDKDDNDVRQIKEQIENDELQEFIKAATDLVDEKDVEELIAKLGNINDTSAKLFYLQNWCNKNADNENALLVIDHALNILTESNEYTPTMRNLRHFATALEKSRDFKKTKDLISKIENLKSTIIKNPVEEYARLELSLAKSEKHWSSDSAEERLYGVFLYLDEIRDADSKCLVLIHLLKSVNYILVNDNITFKQLRDQLIMEFNRLLTSSADHFSISKKILHELTKIDKELAVSFAKKLNNRQRRNMGLAEILKAHIKHSKNVDFVFIEKTLNLVEDKPFRDWITVKNLESFSKLKIDTSIGIKNKYFGLIKDIDSVDGKSLAFSYFISWAKDSTDKSKMAFYELKANLIKIKDVERLRQIGFRIIQNLSKNQIEQAHELYGIITSDYSVGGSRLDDIFSKIMELLIRMVPDILKSEDFRFKVKLIVNSIDSIPSPYQRSLLLSSLAARCCANGYTDILPDCVEKYTDLIESCCMDKDTYEKIIVETGFLLFEYESNQFIEKLQSINSLEYREFAIKNVIRFILSKRPLEDPIDFSAFQQKITFPDAVKVSNLINQLNIDSNIYSMISILVDSLVEPSGNSKYVSRLREKQLLSIAESLIKTINEKLPDEKNIKHEGYKIACFGCVSKLRDTSSNRANKRWLELFPSREQLRKSALVISNESDKVFVLASLGNSTFYTDNVLGLSFIKEAENSLDNLSNPLDRVGRYEMVAESYQKASNDKAAKFILEQAFNTARACSNEQGRDQLLGGLIDLAHSIDPNLAQNYASNIESSESLLNLSERLTTLNLHQDPKKIHSYRKEQTNKVLYEFFSKVLKSLCSSRGTIQHDEIIGQSLNCAEGKDLETISLGISWFVENSIAKNKYRKESELDDLFLGIFQLLDLIKNVENSVSDITASTEGDNFYKVLAETNIQTFSLNEQQEAKELLIDWIRNNAKEYLRIYDPYVGEEVLDLIKSAGTDTRVFIYGSSKTSELEALPNKYRTYWRLICDNVPPETHFQIFATKSGKTPLHDRYLTCEGSALSLGTSLNGLGNKYTSIKFLDVLEKEQIERDFILPLMMPPTHYHEEKLDMKMFSLRE